VSRVVLIAYRFLVLAAILVVFLGTTLITKFACSGLLRFLVVIRCRPS